VKSDQQSADECLLECFVFQLYHTSAARATRVNPAVYVDARVLSGTAMLEPWLWYKDANREDKKDKKHIDKASALLD